MSDDQRDADAAAANNRLDELIEDLLFVLDVQPEVQNIYDHRSEVAFWVLCRTARFYVNSWAAEPPNGSIGDAMIDKFDLEDPARVLDENARLISLLEMTLESVYDNLITQAEQGRFT